MNRIHFLILLLLFIAFGVSSTAIACRTSKNPAMHPVQDYSEIYIAEVVGVHLTEREKQLEKFVSEGQPDTVVMSAVTAEHKVSVVLLEKLRGTPTTKATLSISGCSIRIPALGERGIFFVTSAGDIFPVYTADAKLYEYWVALAKTKPVAKR